MNPDMIKYLEKIQSDLGVMNQVITYLNDELNAEHSALSESAKASAKGREIPSTIHSLTEVSHRISSALNILQIAINSFKRYF